MLYYTYSTCDHALTNTYIHMYAIIHTYKGRVLNAVRITCHKYISVSYKELPFSFLTLYTTFSGYQLTLHQNSNILFHQMHCIFIGLQISYYILLMMGIADICLGYGYCYHIYHIWYCCVPEALPLLALCTVAICCMQLRVSFRGGRRSFRPSLALACPLLGIFI